MDRGGGPFIIVELDCLRQAPLRAVGKRGQRPFDIDYARFYARMSRLNPPRGRPLWISKLGGAKLRSRGGKRQSMTHSNSPARKFDSPGGNYIYPMMFVYRLAEWAPGARRSVG